MKVQEEATNLHCMAPMLVGMGAVTNKGCILVALEGLAMACEALGELENVGMVGYGMDYHVVVRRVFL